ncbi:MAG: cyclic nucleotide-binding domain-containing protein [Pseudomonadota bacterium]
MHFEEESSKRPLVEVFGDEPEAKPGRDAGSGLAFKVAPGQIIISQGDEARYVYRVVRGCLRSCVYTEDGHRRIVSFCGAGSIVGLSLRQGSQWPVSIEAVTNCLLQAAPRTSIDKAIVTSPAIMRDTLAVLREEAWARNKHLVMMGIMPATDRVYAFLEVFAGQRGHDRFVALPISRRDIADYLGLSMETVSRSFTALREAGRIELRGSAKFRLLEEAHDGLGFATSSQAA